MPSPALEFGGEEQFAASPARLFAAVAELDQLAGIIPDLASFRRVSAHEAEAVVRPGFSFLRGTLRLTLGVEEALPPERARMRVAAKGIGVTIGLVSDLAVEPRETGSTLRWSARVETLQGLVASVSPALIRGAADQVIRQAWAKVRAQLGEC